MSEKSSRYNELNPQDTLTSLSFLGPQTGVRLIPREGPEPSQNFENSTFYLSSIPPEHLPLQIQIDARLLNSLTGLGELVSIVRDNILDLEKLQNALDPHRTGYLEANPITVSQIEKDRLANTQALILKKYVENLMRINLLLEAIDNFGGEDDQSLNQIKQSLLNWKQIITELLPLLKKNESIEAMVERELSKQNRASEVQRLVKLISGERAGQNYYQIYKLRERVRKVLLSKTAEDNKLQVRSDLIEELLVTASALNHIRMIRRLSSNGIDLWSMRDRVETWRREYDEGLISEDEINNQLLSQVLVPLSNAIKELFPHIDSTSPSFTAAALYRVEAVCAGRSQIMTSTLSLLNLDARDAFVQKTYDNKSNHAVSVVNGYGGKIIVIDTNYDSYQKYSDAELHELLNDTDEVEKVTANRNKLPHLATALIYTAHPLKKQDVRERGVFVDQRDGEDKAYRASIPYPHPIISRDNKGPISSSILNNYGYVLTNMELYREAEQYFQKAIEINPQNTGAYSNYGYLLLELGRFDEAKKLFKKAIGINPHHAPSRSDYGVLLKKMGMTSEALEQQKKATTISPKEAHYHYLYALLLQDRGNLDEAEKHYKKTLELDSEFPGAHGDYALLLDQLGKLDEAERHFNVAIVIDHKSPIVRTNFGLLLVKLGRPNEAREQFLEALRLDPESEEAGEIQNMINRLDAQNNQTEGVPVKTKATIRLRRFVEKVRSFLRGAERK